MTAPDDILPPWHGRRSVRRYTAQPITRATLDLLLDAAAAAPSAHNRQPWRFAIVTAARRKTELAAAMGARLRQERLADGDAAADVDADVRRSFERIGGAPALVVVCLSMEHMDVYPDERRNRHEHQMAVQSTAMAGQNLLLAADAQGLGACWMCAPLFCPDEVRSALALPQDWEPQGLILLGYPAQPGRNRPRKPRNRIVTFR